MEKTMNLSSYYSSDSRADALDALRQLRRVTVTPGSPLMTIYRAMIIAEGKMLDLGVEFASYAKRLDSYGPVTVTEVDEMIAAVGVEPAKAPCVDCDALNDPCANCDGTGVVFEEVAA